MNRTTTETSTSPTNIRYVKGVGPKKALAFERIGVRSLRDLFYLFPRRYEDRSQFQPIAKLVLHESATVQGEILTVRLKPIRRMPILEVVVGDESGMRRLTSNKSKGRLKS